MRFPALLLPLLLCLGMPGGVGSCGLLRKKPAPTGDRLVHDMLQGRRPMGQITVINAERGYVLVRSPLASVTRPDGALVVKSQGDGTTTCTLKVSPERKRNMVAADIVDGAPKVGDVVFFHTSEKPVSTTPPPAAIGGEAAAATVGGSAGGPGPAEETGELPPLGAPSGPSEIVPDFPDLTDLPEPAPD